MKPANFLKYLRIRKTDAFDSSPIRLLFCHGVKNGLFFPNWECFPNLGKYPGFSGKNQTEEYQQFNLSVALCGLIFVIFVKEKLYNS